MLSPKASGNVWKSVVWRMPALCALCALSCCAAGCADDGRAEAPTNLILISIDTLRPDHLGCYGYDRPTSPTLDKLATEGVLFQNVSSPSPWTLPAHASLLTGRYPSRHGLKSHMQRLPDRVVTLAEILGRHGFQTAAVVNSHNLSERYGLHRGFEHFVYVKEEVWHTLPSAVEAEAVKWLSEQPGEPFFLFLHYYDVHSDYRSLPPYEKVFVRPSKSKADGTTEQLLRFRRGLLSLNHDDAEHLIDRYDAGIRQMDDGIARLLLHLEQTGLLESTLIVVTSDHGEEFLEHDGVLHGRTQFEEVLQVPLILRGPGLPRGLRVEQVASLVDVFPTLIGFLGVPWSEPVDGVDLRPSWQQVESDADPRFLFAEADHNNVEHDIKRAVRYDRFKLHFDIHTNHQALYDLQHDPGEMTDIAAQETSLTQLLRSRLDQFMSVEETAEPIGPMSADEIEKLRSLGYLQ